MMNQKLIELIPLGWDEVECWQLKELIEISENEDELSELEILFEKVSVLCNIPVDDERILKLRESEVIKMFKNLTFLSGAMAAQTPKYILHDDVEYKKISFDDMTAAEWIMAEHLLFKSYKKFGAEIATTVYRRYSINQFGEEIMEPFEFDYEKRVESFSNLTVDKIPFQELIEFRERCFEVFDLTNNIDEDDEPEDEPEEDIQPKTFREKYQEKAAREQESLNNTFRWDKLLMDLSGNDLKKSHELLDMPILYIFRIITMQKNL